MKKQIRALALGLAVAGGLVLLGLSAVPASATEGGLRLPKCHACTTVTHHDTTGILTTSNGEAVTADNQPSTAKVVVGNGVDVTLPDNLAKAGYTVPVEEPVLLSAIAKLQYQTWQLNPAVVALPSLNLTLDFNGAETGGFTTLVYEPYQDGRTIHPNTWQTWDALRNGDAKWWSTRAIPGGASQATPMSWSSILAANPNAVMVAWGLNFGKGAAGAHARWGAVTIGTVDWCTTTIWSPKPTTPPTTTSPTGSPTPTVTQSPTKPASPTPAQTSPDSTTSPGESPADSPAPGGQGGQGDQGIGGGSLALTGQDTPWFARPYAIAGYALMALGAGLGLVWAGRRRRA